jgi:hypothetical protein
MHKTIWLENVKERERFGDLGLDRRTSSPPIIRGDWGEKRPG